MGEKLENPSPASSFDVGCIGARDPALRHACGRTIETKEHDSRMQGTGVGGQRKLYGQDVELLFF